MKTRLAAICVFAMCLAASLPAMACSFASGYFHQVTQLKGRVVGRNLRPLQIHWLQRMFSASGAELDLLPYQDSWLPGWNRNRKPVAHAVTDKSGAFDFGPIKEGHYNLRIKTGEDEDWFDVEITNKVPPTQSVLIDISPVESDCTGGHEFEVKRK